MAEIAKICVDNNLLVLSDEAYFDMLYDNATGMRPSTLFQCNIISLRSPPSPKQTKNLQIYLCVFATELNISHTDSGKSIVSLPHMKERTVILYTFSKSFAMTGWRLGAAIGPEWIINMINKLNTNDESCTTHFIQHAGIAALSEEGKAFTTDIIKQLQTRRDILVKLINEVSQ